MVRYCQWIDDGPDRKKTWWSAAAKDPPDFEVACKLDVGLVKVTYP
jgi:hypothetical protein